MAAIIKDTGEIWSRLFDHRPFVHGEVTFFLREFQDRRDDREVSRLFKSLEYSSELGQSQLDRALQLGDEHLPSLKVNVDVAISMCESVLQKECKFDSTSKLEKNRGTRKSEWEKFINDMTDKCAKVDEEFLIKEKELQGFYADLEEKLHIKS
ncbi:biogenesis of lysosome-related organelles complex 1 subunit 5 [Copidosoma floridanum]|uniref:biogenesis of lysosome-related organelles complex 1 subunit 5 n=1 Tax=Copidosoma floridanum TaxID=29053 RepID=UPI0006C955F6|nr:biogenesis of lysosome-related organelles complex 1 subunit 5 [Copidosoma floridanum]